MSKKRAKGERPPDVEFGIDWKEKAEKQAKRENRQIDFIPTIVRHQYCAYHNLGNGAAYHRRERIKIIWPSYQWHRWNERRLQGFCNYDWLTWWGPAGAAKSTDAVMLGLEYWTEAPHQTAVIVCSTTMKMLRRRIWSQMAHYHTLMPKDLGPVGELLDATTLIRWKQGDDKNGIFGMAVEEGPVEKVINDIIGIHTHRVLLILDEMQGIREAIMRATNNMIANPQFKMLGMGNPDGIQNPLGKESEPIEGWDSVVRGETPEWETLGGPTKGRGLCQFFDGRKSPADDSPEEKARMPWLCNAEWYQGILKAAKGNMNDPQVWQFGIGWPPASGLESTLLDDAILVTFHCKDKAVWTEGYVRCAALDPAFNGGDKAILQFGKRGRASGIGYDDDTRTWNTSVGQTSWIIEFDEWLQVPIDAESSVPIHYQIVAWVRVECEKRGVPPHEFACAAAGEGGGLVSIFQKEWGAINPIEEGGRPSDRHVNNQINPDGSVKTAKECYDTRASELCFGLREFAMANGLRGMSHEAAFQAVSRRTFYRNGKWATEPKTGSKGQKDQNDRPVKGYKQRMGHSPDHLDTDQILVEHCRMQGAEPGVSGAAITETEQQYPRQQVDEFASENYLRPYAY